MSLIIAGLVDLIKTWLEGKKQIHEASIGKEVAQIQNEANWDIAQVEASKTSWKDEWLTILVSIPMILSFVPTMKETVLDGFSVLAQCPDWYQYLIGIVFAASFGVKKVSDVLSFKRGK